MRRTESANCFSPPVMRHSPPHILLLVSLPLLASLAEQGVEPEKPPYGVGGTESRDEYRICFVIDPDGYRVELIDGGAFPTPQDPDR